MTDKLNGLSTIGNWWRGENWLTGVLVDDDTRIIKAINVNVSIADHTQIDVLFLKPGYHPVKGDVLDPSKIILYELKTSASGRIPTGQLASLRAIQGGDIKQIWTRLQWQPSTNTLVDNPRFLRQRDILNALGIKRIGTVATGVAMVVGFANADQAFADLETELFALKRARNPDVKARPSAGRR